MAPETKGVFKQKNKEKRNNRLESVDTLCPESGPLLELEEKLFNVALKDLYADGKISLQTYCLCKLTLVFGARPIQWSKLKINSLDVKQLVGGKSYGLYIPWVKQSKQRRPVFFPLTQHLGAMLLELTERVRLRFPKDALPAGMTWDELPLFGGVREKAPHPPSASLISATIINVGRLANIPNQREQGGSGPIAINALRLRHTVGTRLATKGEYGARNIADYLLHTNIQSPRSYIELKEFLLENFNEYWQVRLKANAKVALGLLSAEEAKMVEGPRITFSEDGRRRWGVGICGKTGCSARAPLACYGCAKFRPLLVAPHPEYLQTLLAERDRQLEVAPKHIDIYDTAIWYVRRVIKACEQIKSGENNG